MDLFSKILNIYLLFNILKKIGGATAPLLVHGSVPVGENIYGDIFLPLVLKAFYFLEVLDLRHESETASCHWKKSSIALLTEKNNSAIRIRGLCM